MAAAWIWRSRNSLQVEKTNQGLNSWLIPEETVWKSASRRSRNIRQLWKNEPKRRQKLRQTSEENLKRWNKGYWDRFLICASGKLSCLNQRIRPAHDALFMEEGIRLSRRGSDIIGHNKTPTDPNSWLWQTKLLKMVMEYNMFASIRLRIIQ